MRLPLRWTNEKVAKRYLDRGEFSEGRDNGTKIADKSSIEVGKPQESL